jgi:hypothetical protein
MAETGSAQLQWHLSRDGKQFGPFSRDQLLQMAEHGKLQAQDLLWTPGYDNWRPATDIPGVLKPPPPPTTPLNNTPSNQTSVSSLKRGTIPNWSESLHDGVETVGKAQPKDRFGLRRLWSGQQPLWKAFWLYFVLGWLGAVCAALVIFLSLAASFEKLGFGNFGAYLGALVIPVALFYFVFAAVGAWRSASWRSVTGIAARIYIILMLIKIGGLIAIGIKVSTG